MFVVDAHGIWFESYSINLGQEISKRNIVTAIRDLPPLEVGSVINCCSLCLLFYDLISQKYILKVILSLNPFKIYII